MINFTRNITIYIYMYCTHTERRISWSMLYFYVRYFSVSWNFFEASRKVEYLHTILVRLSKLSLLEKLWKCVDTLPLQFWYHKLKTWMKVVSQVDVTIFYTFLEISRQRALWSGRLNVDEATHIRLLIETSFDSLTRNQYIYK